MIATPVARTTDPITSVIAGEGATKHSTAKDAVLTILDRHGPLHDEALAEQHEAYVARGLMAPKSRQRLRTARADLVKADRVRESRDEDHHVRTVVLPSGYHSIVWEKKPDAR